MQVGTARNEIDAALGHAYLVGDRLLARQGFEKFLPPGSDAEMLASASLWVEVDDQAAEALLEKAPRQVHGMWRSLRRLPSRLRMRWSLSLWLLVMMSCLPDPTDPSLRLSHRFLRYAIG